MLLSPLVFGHSGLSAVKIEACQYRQGGLQEHIKSQLSARPDSNTILKQASNTLPNDTPAFNLQLEAQEHPRTQHHGRPSTFVRPWCCIPS